MPRSGFVGANQFQQYLNELAGPGGARGDRSGIGVPYYRSAVDANVRREYRPNAATDRSFEESQQLVTDKYLAYFSEREPKKRAALLKEYQQARRVATRALGTRRESPSRVLSRPPGSA
jgi:hypothetical protein